MSSTYVDNEMDRLRMYQREERTPTRHLLARTVLNRAKGQDFSATLSDLVLVLVLQRNGSGISWVREDNGMENPDGVPQPRRGETVHGCGNCQPQGRACQPV